jgi:hypothetical protein
LDLRDFPFDSQKIQLKIVNGGFVDVAPNFIVSSDSGLAEQLKIPDWIVRDWNIESTVLPLGKDKAQVAAVILSVDLQRAISFFTLKVIFPLILIVAMSWLVFWIDPRLVPAQISVGVTTMLTLIAYRFAIGGMVPRLSFLTGLDYFVMGSSAVVFLTLIEVAYMARLIENEQIDEARAVHRKARWLAPVLYLALLLETLWLRWGAF